MGQRNRTKRSSAKARVGASRTGDRSVARAALVAAGVAVLLGVGLIAGISRFRSKQPEELPQRIYELSRGWMTRWNAKNQDLWELVDRADEAVSSGDRDRIGAVVERANELGRELSVDRLRNTSWSVVEDEHVDQLKSNAVEVVSYQIEALDSLEALGVAPEHLRRDLVQQARRLLVLADTALAWTNAVWESSYGVRVDPELVARPVVDERVIREYRWSDDFIQGRALALVPWKLDGRPVEVALEEASGSHPEWATAENRIALELEMTPTVSSTCADLESFQRADKFVVDWKLQSRALDAYVEFSNRLASQEPPRETTLIYAAVWRGTRGFQEALISALAAENMGDLQRRWLFKAYRLAVLGSHPWNAAYDLSNKQGVGFTLMPACQGRLEVVFGSPWFVGQEMTDLIPGPRSR